VTTALDIGTGCGVQALHLAEHAAAVTATDRNPRALAFARTTFDLNGIDTVELVEGDLLEAVADRRFDLLTFLEGAKAAYAMVLEAFWRGDKEELRQLCDDDVYQSFASAIDARAAAGETLDNRLVRIEDTVVHSARLDGRIARIAVAFVADIAAVTRNAEGEVVAGSMSDAVQTRDRWTFRRDIQSRDPNWLLIETDEEE
jgi:predicted lipid-binding transport protein (Tim44 family)